MRTYKYLFYSITSFLLACIFYGLYKYPNSIVYDSRIIFYMMVLLMPTYIIFMILFIKNILKKKYKLIFFFIKQKNAS
ncbi:MAG: hypothetical protein ACI90Q_001424 [Nonlabens sp.]|jgi:hypothetical protein